ncbi:ead/Ea22-like family protein [Klebsiella aerogenes]
MTDITELTSVQKNANIHRLSRLIDYASNDELRQTAVEVEHYTDQLIEALEKAQQRNAKLESSGTAPGILRCTECSFVQTKNIISVTADTITTVEIEPEPCPNGCGQLQPVTWKALAIQLMFTTKQGLSDLLEAKKRIAELEREQEHLRPVGVMSEKAFHRLENSESRFIALWPRPGIFLPRKRPEDGVIVYARIAAAAGIKVEAE